MIVLNVRNVNNALAAALKKLKEVGEVRSSRNGTVYAFNEAVSTVYTSPQERVLFSPMRRANPTFHLVESLWMLAGRNDVDFPATFVKNMKNFSDDTKTFWGAYGHRWRQFFGFDQIKEIINQLRANPDTRRCVMAMWNGMNVDGIQGGPLGDTPPDLIQAAAGGKDVPCNTHIYFDLRGGKLNMLVSCRSNDILWGAYGANAVHMSILQEYIALSLEVPMGTYTQMSNDLHLYNATAPEKGLDALINDVESTNLYEQEGILGSLRPLWNHTESQEQFDDDLEDFFYLFDHNREGFFDSVLSTEFNTNFFNEVVVPMIGAWYHRKDKSLSRHYYERIGASDWYCAMRFWLQGAN